MNERQQILIADDSMMNREILTDMLGDSYDIIEAENGAQAVQLMQDRAGIDLLLLDINMPEMDGFGVLTIMNKFHWIDEIPVIMISAENASTFIEHAYDMGATDYINRPFDMAIVRRRVVNALNLYTKQKRLVHLVADQVRDKEKSNRLMINILSHIVEFRNGESGLHVLHIQTATEIILTQLAKMDEKYALDPAEISLISTASALHDIGKISIPESILNKPGRLTKEEFDTMKTHTIAGAEMLENLPFEQEEPLVKMAHDICRWHHERWDGRGYPDGLVGEQIPISAQAVALADVYDALTSERCYKKAFDHETAMRMILNGECGAFNPVIMDCFVEIGPELHAALSENGDESLDNELAAQQISNELLRGEALPNEDRTAFILAMERDKNSFYESHAEVLQFNYNAITDTVSMCDWAAEHLHCEKTMHFSSDDEIEKLSFLSAEDSKRLRTAVLATTPSDPNTELIVLIQIDGSLRWHRILAQSLWTHEGKPQFLGFCAQAADIHDLTVENADAADAPPSDVYAMSAQSMAALLKSLQGLFKTVRLVDVVQARALTPTRDCHAEEPPHPCYAMWARDKRCEGCVSSKAFAHKTQLAKLEFVGDKAFQLFSKYVEVDGRPCVLELVNELQDELLMGAYAKSNLSKAVNDFSHALYRDPLTGVYNRYYFNEQKESLESSCGVAMADANHFKSINDTYGHQVGDEALRAIARAMLSCIRSSDVVIRYGGDEFVILFRNIPQDVFELRLTQICKAVSDAKVDSAPDLKLSISIGGVFGAHPLKKALKQADLLMYTAKNNKANTEHVAIHIVPPNTHEMTTSWDIPKAMKTPRHPSLPKKDNS